MNRHHARPAGTRPVAAATATASALATLLALGACGGGGAGPTAVAGVSSETAASPDAVLAAGGPTESARATAAAATARSASNACAQARPFYWEIGDARGARASGSVAGAEGTLVPQAGTPMHFASATKWLYAAYAMERSEGRPTAVDTQMLTMRSGYKNLAGSCDRSQSIDGCLAEGLNGTYTVRADGRYFYNGGHMQVHASRIGLGALDAAGLGAELRRVLGPELAVDFSSPLPAGGAYGTPEAYSGFLRKLLRGELKLGNTLGTPAACASLAGCNFGDVMYSPAIPGERAHYALGHWVETDPASGDGAFSSAGAFGFYPWIDAGRSHYGVVARQAPNGAHGSMRCGRLIRRAWASAQVM